MRLVFAILALIPVLASAQSNAQIQELFNHGDADHDGSITEEESQRIYQHIDTNGNGKVTEQELDTALGEINPSDEKFARKFLRAFDANKDCSISDSEWLLVFREIDTNHDGEFNESEFEEFFATGFP